MRGTDHPAAPAAGRTRAEAFASSLRATLDQAMLALLVAAGHRAGLFEALASLGPASSAALAAARSLNEPALRAWLGAMVTGRVIDYDGARDVFRLPPEHAGALVGAAGLAALAERLAVTGPSPGELVARLRGRGKLRRWADAFGDALALMVPRVVGGTDVLVVGKGAKALAARLALRFGRSRFQALATADVVVLVDPLATATLARARRALRPRGQLLTRQPATASHLSDDVDHPHGALVYGAAALAGGARPPWGDERTRAALAAAGFAEIAVRLLPADPLHAYYAATVC